VGRTGSLWAHQSAGVEPDMMTIAKPVAGGLPMGGILMTQTVADAIQPGDHGSTFAGGPFVSQVARTVFGKISSPEFLDRVAECGEQLERGLQTLAESSPLVVKIRGRGMMWGVVTTIPAADVVNAAQTHGLLVISAGTDVVRLLPPLSISSEEIDLLLEKLQTALKDCE